MQGPSPEVLGVALGHLAGRGLAHCVKILIDNGALLNVEERRILCERVKRLFGGPMPTSGEVNTSATGSQQGTRSSTFLKCCMHTGQCCSLLGRGWRGQGHELRFQTLKS